jgi:hypothetical protein
VIRIALLHLRHLAQILFHGAVADELDIVEAHDALAVPVRGRVARAHIGTTGSPMVFHTAPPQPASKARMIISPVLVGGAEASQNGFGRVDAFPQNSARECQA